MYKLEGSGAYLAKVIMNEYVKLHAFKIYDKNQNRDQSSLVNILERQITYKPKDS